MEEVRENVVPSRADYASQENRGQGACSTSAMVVVLWGAQAAQKPVQLLPKWALLMVLKSGSRGLRSQLFVMTGNVS